MASKRSKSDSVSPPPLKRKRREDSSPANEHSLTVYSWNVNGLASFLQPDISSFFRTATAGPSVLDANSLRSVLRRYSWPTILLLQEVKISPQDGPTLRAVQKAVKALPGEPDYNVHFCLPRDSHNARGFGRKVYGVCSIFRQDFYDKFVDRVRECDWDLEGRVLICETRAVDNIPKLAIINLYAVNGTDLPYKDSSTGQVIGTRHDRKLQVHALLQAECRVLEADGFQVILAGDINVARSSLDGHPRLRESPRQHCINRADFEARFLSSTPAQEKSDEHETGAGLNMVDSFRHLHPQTRGYTYYPRTGDKVFGTSCDRVDMILLSRQLEPQLKKAGMHETPADRGTSDHVPLYAMLAFE